MSDHYEHEIAGLKDVIAELEEKNAELRDCLQTAWNFSDDEMKEALGESE